MPGKPRAFIHFLVFVALLGIALAFGSRAFDNAIGFVGLGFCVVGSIVLLGKTWKGRGNPQGTTFPAQISFLPKKWQKWLLGESEDDKR